MSFEEWKRKIISIYGTIEGVPIPKCFIIHNTIIEDEHITKSDIFIASEVHEITEKS